MRSIPAFLLVLAACSNGSEGPSAAVAPWLVDDDTVLESASTDEAVTDDSIETPLPGATF